jgi:hypothetical protein
MEKIFAPDESRECIRGWIIHARKCWKKHGKAALQLESRYRLIGTASLVLSAVVGGALFSSLQADFESWVKIAAGCVSILAAVLAALLTFQRYEERTEKHRSAAGEYKVALRTLEQMHSEIHERKPNQESFTRIKEKLDALDETAPVVPEKIHAEVEKDYEDYIFEPKAGNLRPGKEGGA